MAVFEGTHGNLLQGVSQQIPRSRMEGQVSEQINMVSDPVTGLRRRQGCTVKELTASATATANSIKSWRTDISGVPVELSVESNSGTVFIKEGSKITTLQADYLKSVSISNIRQASIGESVYILNKDKIPKGVLGTVTKGDGVGESGFANFLTGALNRTFTVTVRLTRENGTVVNLTGSYSTPDGTKPEHVQQVTPEYIATQVANALVSNRNSQGVGANDIDIVRINEVVVVRSKTGTVRVLANASDLYVVTSNVGNLKNVGMLPDRMVDWAVSFSVGNDRALSYYQYDIAKGVWKETSSVGSVKEITNMPVEIYWDTEGDKWVLNTSGFAGRLAGDDENNPDPDFIDWGITGISSYQGRLVLLSGSYVWLSASGLPRLFYRTTVEELLDTDPIGIGSSSATSASFQYAVNFNKDLILFSSEHQAIIAGSNIAITPKTANIMVTSTYTADMSIEPVTLGRSVMYPMPRSRTHYGMLEMIPSPYTDSMYISTDVTEHIPTYLEGRCRIAVSSTVGSIALFGSTEEMQTLYVHEYVWEGEEKLLKAWHKWVFSYPIADVFFDGDLINIVFVNQGVVLTTYIDPRVNEVDSVGFLDYREVYSVDYTGSPKVTLKELYNTFMCIQCTDLRVSYSGGDLKGYEVGSEYSEGSLLLNKSTDATEVNVGISFRSEVEPSPPIVRDHEGIPVTTNRLNIINYYCTTENSGTYTVTIKDKARQSLNLEFDTEPVKWLSTELNIGHTPLGGLSGDIVPCRVPSNSSEIKFFTEDIYEMNIVSLEYVCLYNFRRQRR